LPGQPQQLPRHNNKLANYKAEHVLFEVKDGVATLTLNRPERKNPLSFESYAEMRDLFRALSYAEDVHAVVVTGAGGNFCSGGDVHEIIGPLTQLDMPGLLTFTRMTGDLVKAMRACPQPIISASMAFVPVPAPCWPWRPTCATAQRAAKLISCSTKWAWQGVTWAHVPCCRE